MARRKPESPATIFPTTVRLALEHFAEPSWLGRNSALASPYFLGERRLAGVRLHSPEDRGRLLQDAIRDAVAQMWPGTRPSSRGALMDAVEEERRRLGSKSPKYHYLLLELRYLRQHYPPNTFPTAVESIPDFVNVSPTRFFIHIEEAIDNMSRNLLERLAPSLRQERPALARVPIGRTAAIDEALDGLNAGRSVAISGMGGVGKTTVGAAIIARWPGEVFWHTFHPGLNDDLSSLLFNLGHFTREAGAPTLWAQLLAGEGRSIPLSQAIGMLRKDLETIAMRRPLLCFDEMDLLQTAVGEPRRKQHAQTLEFLESLQDMAPLLLIGQRVYVDTDIHVGLQPLSVGESNELLHVLGVEPKAVTLHHIHQYTGGNPRLVELYAALRQSGDEVEDVRILPQKPSAQPLFSRLWRRLGPNEKEMLAVLSVFRSHAPRDGRPHMEQALTELITRGLIKTDLAGGIALLPFIRALVFDALSPERKMEFHLNAARIRAQLGDYTAAAYHYAGAGETESAIEIWFFNQDKEILAGQAFAADEIFRQIKPNQMADRRRKELLAIQNRLAILVGEADRVLEGMEGFSWDVDDELTADLIGQWGLASETLGRTEQALDKYDEAIAMLTRTSTKIAVWHLRRGLVFISETDAGSMEIEAELAQYNVERLRGMIEFMKGRFESASHYLQTALHIAEAAADKEKIAHAHFMLALIEGRQARIDHARSHAEAAMSYYSQIGNRLLLEGVRAELAGMLLNVRQFDVAIEPAEKSLRYFELIKHEQWISSISNTLAEAYMETGRLADAKTAAYRVLHLEVPRSRPYALYTLGHIHDREGNAAHAATSFKEGIEVARANGDPFIEAYLLRALGALLARGEQPAQGVKHLEQAMTLFTEMKLEHEIPETASALQSVQSSISA